MVEIILTVIQMFWGIKISITNTSPQLPKLFEASFETYKLTQQIIGLDNENEEYQDQTVQLQTNCIIHFKCNHLEDHCSNLETQLKQTRNMEVSNKNQDLNMKILSETKVHELAIKIESKKDDCYFPITRMDGFPAIIELKCLSK